MACLPVHWRLTAGSSLGHCMACLPADAPKWSAARPPARQVFESWSRKCVRGKPPTREPKSRHVLVSCEINLLIDTQVDRLSSPWVIVITRPLRRNWRRRAGPRPCAGRRPRAVEETAPGCRKDNRSSGSGRTVGSAQTPF